VGKVAEQRALDYLREQGYVILCRNYKVSNGEIDVIAMEAETIVFVEVRFRTDDEAEGSIGTTKIAALRRAGQAYLNEMEQTREYRFDLIAVSPHDLRHHRDFLRS
jgi:putative endonuclease